MKEYSNINVISSQQREKLWMSKHDILPNVSMNIDDFKNHKWRIGSYPDRFEKIPLYKFRVEGKFILLPGRKLYSLTICDFYRIESL